MVPEVPQGPSASPLCASYTPPKPSGDTGSVGAGNGVDVADARSKGSPPSSSLFIEDTDALGRIVSRMFTTELQLTDAAAPAISVVAQRLTQALGHDGAVPVLQQLTAGINDADTAAIASALRVVLTGEAPSGEEAEVIRIISEHIALAGSPAATLTFQAPIGAAHEVALPGAGLPAHACNGLLMTCHQAILTAADTAPSILDTTIGQQLSAYAAYVQQATRIEEAKQSAQMTAISHLHKTDRTAMALVFDDGKANLLDCLPKLNASDVWRTQAWAAKQYDSASNEALTVRDWLNELLTTANRTDLQRIRALTVAEPERARF